jgi:UrcA family protein
MKNNLLVIAIGVAASMSLGSVAAAQEVQEIVVTAKGVVSEKPAGKTASGVPIVNMSVSYGVSYAGLDLASAAGAAEIEKRVNDAAKEACKTIAAQHPLTYFTTNDAECTKAAAGKAMVKAHALIAEAGKKSAK